MMRYLPALAVVLVVAGGVPAQPPMPPAAPPAPAEDPRLDALLARWEAATTNIQSLVAEVVCTRKNPVFNKTEVLVGSAKFLRLPDGTYGAKLDLQSQDNPNRYERYVSTGRAIYVYRPDEKAVYVYDLPAQTTGRPPDDGAMPFLVGMKAATAKKRYTMKISKIDENYTYLEIYPNFDRDRADFIYAKLSLFNKDWPKWPKDTPYYVYWVEPNNVEVRWDIKQLQRDVPGSVDRREFDKPTLPPGWQLKTDPQRTTPPPASGSRPPTVIRSKDK
jgi:TIGR03009 family protein